MTTKLLENHSHYANIKPGEYKFEFSPLNFFAGKIPARQMAFVPCFGMKNINIWKDFRYFELCVITDQKTVVSWTNRYMGSLWIHSKLMRQLSKNIYIVKSDVFECYFAHQRGSTLNSRLTWESENSAVASFSDWNPGVATSSPILVHIRGEFLRSCSDFRWIRKDSCQLLAKAQYRCTD